jgi:hypothetical protein
MPSPFLVTTQARLLCLQRLRRRLHLQRFFLRAKPKPELRTARLHLEPELQRFFDSAQRNTERLSHLRVARQQAP